MALMAVLTLWSASCGDKSGEALRLDGSPRIPNVEGVVRRVDLESLELADGRRFRLERDLQSFSTYTLKPLAILGREGQYVQMSVDDKKVRWIASVGAVVRGSPPSVFYTGYLLRVDEQRLIFRDGTTFRTTRPVADDLAKSFVIVEIDPDRGVVRSLSRN